MCVANVHTTVTAYENEEYKKVQNGAALCIPDGKPLSVVQKKRGFKNAQRVTGPSLMEEILKISRENGYRHVFYGSTQETLDKIQTRIKREYPDTEENFLYISPEFKETAEPETEEVINKINDFKPDFVWVGLGAPLREFLYVDDLADACVFLMNNYSGNETVNLGTGKELSIKQLTELVAKVVGYTGKISWDSTKPDGTPRKLLDVSKLSSLGWHYKTELEDGIRLTYADFLNNPMRAER